MSPATLTFLKKAILETERLNEGSSVHMVPNGHTAAADKISATTKKLIGNLEIRKIIIASMTGPTMKNT